MLTLNTQADVHRFPPCTVRPGPGGNAWFRIAHRVSELKPAETAELRGGLARVLSLFDGQLDDVLALEIEGGQDVTLECPGGCWEVRPHGKILLAVEGQRILFAFGDGEVLPLDWCDAFALLLSLRELRISTLPTASERIQ